MSYALFTYLYLFEKFVSEKQNNKQNHIYTGFAN